MCRIALLVLIGTLSACGQVGFSFVDANVVDIDTGADAGPLPTDAAPTDSGLTDSGHVDAFGDAGALDGGDAGVSRCDDWTTGSFTFDVVGRVATGSITGERGEMRVSRDGSMMYFGFDDDVYQAPRVSELVFAPATLIPGLDTEEATFGANLTADGLSALVMVDGGGHVDIWRYDRPTTADAFVPTRAVDELNTPGEDWDPLLTSDGLGVYFGRSLGDVGSIIYARRPSENEGFTIEQTFFNEPFGVFANPSFTDDETVLLMNTRDAGRSHIHYALRAKRGDSFMEPTLLPGVQERTETEPFLTPDGCELYYTAQSETDGYRMLLARYRRL